MNDSYALGRFTFRSRLIVGTGKYASLEQTRAATEASGADLVTVALRRVNLAAPEGRGLLDALPPGTTILPNTAGCYTVEDAVTTARLGRELLGTGPWGIPQGTGLMSGFDWLRFVAEHFEKSVWLNPDPPQYWSAGTAKAIGELFPMYHLTLEGLTEAMAHLSKGPVHKPRI